MPQRYRLTIEYDGTDFCGWQRQRCGRSVQGELETVLQTLNGGEPVTLIGSGRTDAGVHSLGQVAHVDLSIPRQPETIQRALNAQTGRDIQVRGCQIVDADFHARFSARRRHYLYRICRRIAVLERRTSWQLPGELDEDCLQECAKLILGEHDFSRLCSSRTEAASKICQISDSQWIKEDIFINYKIVGNRFLHSMVRMIVGTMITIARGKGSPADLQALLDGEDGMVQVHTAPPQGLILQQVDYE
ncbi:MAG: tRNA pseudouridine(38-40) synthase TruA [Deltaproteobacteria bacterium]|nr:MAG: tRNA pseudouridine(38-40) synthase TruA [Deltaproteobacteria bacterium]